ncbi:MAG: hypothetical protein AB1498_13290, partial [bacterium]
FQEGGLHYIRFFVIRLRRIKLFLSNLPKKIFFLLSNCGTWARIQNSSYERLAISLFLEFIVARFLIK